MVSGGFREVEDCPHRSPSQPSARSPATLPWVQGEGQAGLSELTRVVHPAALPSIL